MKLALRIPPPVQALAFGILMWIVDKQLPGGQIEFGMQLPVSIVFAIDTGSRILAWIFLIFCLVSSHLALGQTACA